MDELDEFVMMVFDVRNWLEVGVFELYCVMEYMIFVYKFWIVEKINFKKIYDVFYKVIVENDFE